MANKLTNKFHWMPALLLVLSLVAMPAMALDLSQAKEQGLVRETPRGYITAVDQSPNVMQLVDRVNTGRKAAYQDIAKKRGTPLSAVEQLAGQKLTGKAGR